MTGEPAQFIKGKTIQEQMMQILKMLRQQAADIQDQIDDLQHQIDDIGAQTIQPIVDGTVAAMRAVEDESGNNIEDTYETIGNAAATYATQSALSSGLTAKADKATSLAGYGITDAVALNGNQTVNGTKTFTSDIYTTRTNPASILKDSSTTYADNATHGRIEFQDKNGIRLSMHRTETSSSGGINHTTARITAHTRDGNNTERSANLEVHQTSDGTGWSTTPARPYNAANINDIQTIGAIAANPSIIHTTGNETKLGNLTIQGVNYASGSFQQAPVITSRFGNSGPQATMNCMHDTSDAVNAVIGLKDAQNKTCELRLINYPANNETSLYLITRNGTWHLIASYTD